MTKFEFVVSWFQRNVGKKFTNAELERQLRTEYESAHGVEFRDPLREVRKAYAEGLVRRTAKGPGQVYWCDPRK